jgi:hypothetical protein
MEGLRKSVVVHSGKYSLVTGRELLFIFPSALGIYLTHRRVGVAMPACVKFEVYSNSSIWVAVKTRRDRLANQTNTQPPS